MSEPPLFCTIYTLLLTFKHNFRFCSTISIRKKENAKAKQEWYSEVREREREIGGGAGLGGGKESSVPKPLTFRCFVLSFSCF